MKDKLLHADVRLLGTGLMPGLSKTTVPFWEDARNVDFDDHGVHSNYGYASLQLDNDMFDSAAGMFDSAAGLFDSLTTSLPLALALGTPITGLIQQRQANGIVRVVIGTYNALWLYEGGAAVDVTKAGGYSGIVDETLDDIATRWSMVQWGDQTFATNGVDTPQRYNAGPDFENVPGLTFTRAEIFMKLGPHLLAFNTSNGYKYIEWCAEDNPTQWDPGVYLTAGFLVNEAFDGPIIAACQLADGIAVYGASGLSVLRYVGGKFLFGIKPALATVSAVSKNSVAAAGAVNYGLTREGVFATDGQSFKWVSYPKLGEWLEQNINWAQKSKIVGYHTANHRQVRWAIPLVGSNEPNLVLCYNYQADRWTFYTQVFTAASSPGATGGGLIGLPTGQVYRADITDYANGEIISRWARTKPWSVPLVADQMGQPRGGDLWKLVDTIRAEIRGSGLKVELGVAPGIGSVDSFTWTDIGTLSETETTLYSRAGGVWLQLKFSSPTGTPFSLDSLEVLGRIVGRRV